MSGYYMRESSEALKEMVAEAAAKENKRMKAILKESQDRYDEVRFIKEHREFLDNKKRNFRDTVLTECLSSSLKGIYITGLMKNMALTKENVNIAESMVDTFITNAGGAHAVLRQIGGKSYLLESLRKIIEDTAEEIENTATEEEKEFNEVPEEQKDKMLDKLEKEEEVDVAVDLIADRIASAEEEFIKKNKEDKDKIEQIVSDINDRISAVKADLSKSDEVKEQIEQECARECKRKVGDVYNNRSHTIFEHMVTQMTGCVLKDAELKEQYTNSSVGGKSET